MSAGIRLRALLCGGSRSQELNLASAGGLVATGCLLTYLPRRVTITDAIMIVIAAAFFGN